MSCYAEQHSEAVVGVAGARDADGVTLYTIAVRVARARWTVERRYREFAELHARLVAEHGVARDLLPPKRAIRNRCPKFVERRRELLDAYVRRVLEYLQLTMPREFAAFLDLHRYDVLFSLQDFALECYEDGDRLLATDARRELEPLLLHAISRRLKTPCTFFEIVDRKYDFSHVLDFCSRLGALLVQGSDVDIGTSNICPNKLSFDLIAFKSLTDLLILSFPMSQISDTGNLRETLRRFRVHNTDATSLSDIILCDALHKDAVDDEKKMIWKRLEEVDFSCNNIKTIDSSVRLLPKLQKLTLNRNRISEIANLSSLPHLSHLSLSENLFAHCDDWHSKLGKITSIDLSQNEIASLAGFGKLYSLESLDLSCNRVVDVEEAQHICNLPCLENLRLTANPVASVVDYRVKIIEQFNGRMQDICLDSEKPSEKELDTARVLQALRIVKEGKSPSFFNGNDQGFATVTARGGCGL